MQFLNSVFKESDEYGKIEKAIKGKKTPAAFNGFSHIHKALAISSYCSEGRKAFVLTSDEAECVRLSEDLEALGKKTLLFPARDFTLKSVSVYSKEYEHKRIGTLTSILVGDFDVVLASVDAAMQITIPMGFLNKHTFTIQEGDEIKLDDLMVKLISSGFSRCDMVEGTGQFSIRGGIVDIFSPNHKNPIRIDFWGDEVDKISYIDVVSQRSISSEKEIMICPASEVFFENAGELIEKIENYLKTTKKISDKAVDRINKDIDAIKSGVAFPIDRYMSLIFEGKETIFNYLENCQIFASESLKIAEKIRTTLFRNEEDIKDLYEEGSLSKGQDDFYLQRAEFYNLLERRGVVFLEGFIRSSYEIGLKALETVNLKQSSLWSGSILTLVDDIKTTRKDAKFLICTPTKKSGELLLEELENNGIKARFSEEIKKLVNGITITVGGLSAGFNIPSLDFTFISQGKTSVKNKKIRQSRKDAKPYGSLEELHKGDYVVHASHGIGIFDGINSMSVAGIKKDYIKIQYAGKDVLYVPVTQLDLVSKYIGPREDSGVRLHKLGGTQWHQTRQRVKSAVKNMAKQLTALYAKRMQTKGFAFSADGDLQSDFESRFEHEETDDQLRCAMEIKGDMEREVPMDRLLCGDVGFGKTEVALRAAFKCIADGKQCAILVPTTILAWQHYNTTLARMGNLPVNVDMLSRFRTKKQQTEIIRKLKSGELDILIGTHRLISKDVQFRDLGLVIIDEEQRFGVEQKEKLKELFPSVDVLTLSATPIPRTLNMAMSGLRDMSVIEEAPQDRHPVQTYVIEQDNGIIIDAISKELRRGGQVYYLHNRVESIEATAIRLQMALPEARIGVAHGKMDEKTLSRVWQRLIENEIDILVCTSIIETGVDVPNANTLIIEDADRMGLSQLHQLRGRVGRSARRAYAYLCFKRGKALSDIATKRLVAIREFTEFGSGFKIAMRDLEIRGAGSILGGEQHGHMEAVGYDMYLKLLSEAISEENGETPKRIEEECLVDISIAAHIPEDYIESLPARLGVYRRIADVKNREDIEDVVDELIDRFGEPPKSVLSLCEISLIRKRAAALGIKEISQREGSLLIFINNIASPAVANACSKLKGRAMLNAGNKPYIAVRIDKKESYIKNLQGILEIMEDDL